MSLLHKKQSRAVRIKPLMARSRTSRNEDFISRLKGIGCTEDHKTEAVLEESRGLFVELTGMAEARGIQENQAGSTEASEFLHSSVFSTVFLIDWEFMPGAPMYLTEESLSD